MLTAMVFSVMILPPYSELADIPQELRQPNYTLSDPPWGRPGSWPGSCANATNVTILRWYGFDRQAEWWRNNMHSGRTKTRVLAELESSGLRYAYTDTGDVKFLEWAARNRMMVGLFYPDFHAQNLVDFTPTEAILLDNNFITGYRRVPRESFLRQWRSNQPGAPGFAWCLVYFPPPPYPIQLTR